MPNGSEKHTDKRKNEIIGACEKLYRSKGYKDITIKDISTETTFSRPSIYNYFETKEEIFLALLTKECDSWTADLCRIGKKDKTLTGDELAKEIAATLDKRDILLKVTAMNLFEIEEHSRLERLVEYKKAFCGAVDVFTQCLETCLPDCSEEKIEAVKYAFFPFMYGVYPYANPTKKQHEAMAMVGIRYDGISVYELVYRFLKQIL